MRRTILVSSVLGLGAIASSAYGELVNITAIGDVEFNVIGGNQTNVPDGAPVVMSFNVDSDVFVNSPNFPTRGYNVILSSFSLTAGGQPINIVDPQPSPAFFVLRNNDPAVDGYFLSRNIDIPLPVAVTIPGLTPVHDLDFSRSFANGTPFPSLNILDCLGTYDLTNIGSFLWTVGRFGNAGAEYNHQTVTISVVPEPASLVLLAPAALLRRRRR